MKISPALLRKISRTALIAALGLSVSSCGGGSGSSNTQLPNGPNSGGSSNATPTATTTALVYLTDSFDTQYEAVWVTVTKIVAYNGATETVLADYSASPLAVNLPTLKRAGLLVSKSAIPLDTTEIRIFVDGEARLVGLDGVTQTVPLARVDTGYLRVAVSGLSSGTGTLALDFDLPNFQLVNGVLQPATRLATQADVNEWTSRHGEIEGVVSAVSASSLTITSAGQTYTFALGDYTSYRSRTSTTWRPVAGERVEVNAIVGGTAASPTFQALSVHSENLVDRVGTSDAPEVQGRIVSINGDTVKIAVEEAEDIRLAGTVELSLAGARFTRGAASLLAVGQRIEAHLASTPAGGWQALVVEIEGARKTEFLSSGITNGAIGSDDDGEGYAEVKGQVTALAGNQVTLNIYKVERAGTIQIGTSAAFDLTSTVFTEGSLTCLQAGAALEIKGYLNGSGAFVPSFAELDGACGTVPSGGSTVAPTAIMEAKGRILSVGQDSFVIEVFKVEDWYGTAPAQLTVRYDSATFFEDLFAQNLTQNLLVEVKGRVDGSTMAAVKIERD